MFADEKSILNRLNSKENVLNIIFDNPTENVSEDSATTDLESHDEQSEASESVEQKTAKEQSDALALLDFAVNAGHKKGRGKELSAHQRADIALMGTVLGTLQAKAHFGGQPAVYQNNKINFYDDDNSAPASQKARYRDKLQAIRDVSADKLLKIVGVIPEEKLEEIAHNNPLKATQIATNLSRIIEKVTPKETEEKPIAQFFIYQPQQAKEEEYEVIDV